MFYPLLRAARNPLGIASCNKSHSASLPGPKAAATPPPHAASPAVVLMPVPGRAGILGAFGDVADGEQLIQHAWPVCTRADARRRPRSSYPPRFRGPCTTGSSPGCTARVPCPAPSVLAARNVRSGSAPSSRGQFGATAPIACSLDGDSADQDVGKVPARTPP